MQIIDKICMWNSKTKMLRKDYILREIDKAIQLIAVLLKLQQKNDIATMLKGIEEYFSLEEIAKYIRVETNSIEIDKEVFKIRGWQQLLELWSDIYEIKFKATGNYNDIFFSVQTLEFLIQYDSTTFSFERNVKLNERNSIYKSCLHK